MKLVLSSLCLVVLGAVSTASMAQDNAAFLKQLDAKSAMMKRCADMARALEKKATPQ